MSEIDLHTVTLGEVFNKFLGEGMQEMILIGIRRADDGKLLANYAFPVRLSREVTISILEQTIEILRSRGGHQ